MKVNFKASLSDASHTHTHARVRNIVPYIYTHIAPYYMFTVGTAQHCLHWLPHVVHSWPTHLAVVATASAEPGVVTLGTPLVPAHPHTRPLYAGELALIRRRQPPAQIWMNEVHTTSPLSPHPLHTLNIIIPHGHTTEFGAAEQVHECEGM